MCLTFFYFFCSFVFSLAYKLRDMLYIVTSLISTILIMCLAFAGNHKHMLGNVTSDKMSSKRSISSMHLLTLNSASALGLYAI